MIIRIKSRRRKQMPVTKEKKALLANTKKKAKQKAVKHLTLKTDVHELSNMGDEKN